jgi:hypothetical protein
MSRLPLPFAAAVLLLLPGCLAKTAIDVVTLPVRITGKAVGAALPSQRKRDEKRGRAMRKYEECLGKEERNAAKQHRPAEAARCGEAP